VFPSKDIESYLLTFWGRPIISIKATTRTIGAMAILALSTSPARATPAPQFANGLTVTTVADVDFEAELVEIYVSQPVVTGCTGADYYVVRDTNIIKGSLAIATAALIAGRTIDLYVAGTKWRTTGDQCLNALTSRDPSTKSHGGEYENQRTELR
jgi:hypothetical protein